LEEGVGKGEKKKTGINFRGGELGFRKQCGEEGKSRESPLKS